MPPPSTWLSTSSASRSGSLRARPADADRDVGLLDRATECRERPSRRHRWRALHARNFPRGRTAASTAPTIASWSMSPAAATTSPAGRYRSAKNAADVVCARVASTVSKLPAVSRPSGCSGKSDSTDERVHEVVGRVVVHQELFEDDLALGVDVVVAERRLGEHVAEEVEAELDSARPAAGCSTRCTPSW